MLLALQVFVAGAALFDELPASLFRLLGLLPGLVCVLGSEFLSLGPVKEAAAREPFCNFLECGRDPIACAQHVCLLLFVELDNLTFEVDFEILLHFFFRLCFRLLLNCL